MKRFIMCLVIIIIACLTIGAATAEPLGFGCVNDKDVALRRGVGGKIVARLPKDTWVWINDSKTDNKGVLWYEIKAGVNVDHANYDYSGWMMAKFIDAGASVWHDITEIAASNHGLIALRSDGSVETAGKPIVYADGSGWISPKGWADKYGSVFRVGVPNSAGNEYFILTANDEFVSSVNGQRIPNGLAKFASRTSFDEYAQDEPFPAWYNDPDLIDFCAFITAKNEQSIPERQCIGVRTDGTVITEPSFLEDQLGEWTDIVDICVSYDYVMGLKKDGTVVMAPFKDGVAMDVSHWRNIVDIGAGSDWCVGLKDDGTLVFAGDHVYMNQGHWVK